jgi:hypothetical protein
MIDAYRGTGVATWKRIEIDVHELGKHAAFTTVRWNALDAEGNVLRDTRTTYHLLSTPDGWRFLSYTNHFCRLAARHLSLGLERRKTDE